MPPRARRAQLAAFPASLDPQELVPAYPGPDEDYVLAHGIRTTERLTEVMSRPDKSPTLIDALIGGLRRGWGPYRALSDEDVAQLLMSLLEEPALTTRNVRNLAHFAVADLPRHAELLTAICVHPVADNDAVITAVWYATGPTAQDIAVATGLLLPAAVNWVSREVDRATCGHRDWAVSSASRKRATQVAQRWEAWAGTDRNLVLFLVTSSFTFTDEDDLFAAGRAVCAAPGA